MLWPKPGFEQKPKPSPLEISLASAASKGSFPFSPPVPLLWAYLAFFSSTKLHVCSGLSAPCQPQGSHVGDVQCTAALPCASPLGRSCCAFSPLIPQGHLFRFFVFSWRKNSGCPPISMKLHKRDFPFSSAGHSQQKFEWCHHFEGVSPFLGPYSEKCLSSLENQGLLLYILSWVLFPLVQMAILNNRIPCTAHGDTWKL